MADNVIRATIRIASSRTLNIFQNFTLPNYLFDAFRTSGNLLTLARVMSS